MDTTKILGVAVFIIAILTWIAIKFGNKWVDEVSSKLDKAVALMADVNLLKTRLDTVVLDLDNHIREANLRFGKLEKVNRRQIHLQKETIELIKSLHGRRSDDKVPEKA